MLSSVLKSTSLALALINDKITIEQAISLSRIEENF
jgi:hypothetical protein